MGDKMSLIRRSETKLRERLDHEPTDEEIADDRFNASGSITGLLK